MTARHPSVFSLIVLISILCLPVQTRAATVYVSPDGSDAWSGKLPAPNRTRSDGPFATPQKARDALHGASGPKRIVVRGGTYYLRAPVVLTPADSGLAFLAFPGEHPVFSGGRPITGWKRGNGPLWTADLPDVRAKRWRFGQIRVGGEIQPPARDPASGWRFVPADDYVNPQYNTSVRRIEDAGDWLEWQIEAPATDVYHVWFQYAIGIQNPGFPPASGRSVLQADGGKPVTVENLPSTDAFDVFKWSPVAALPVKAGKRVLRWTNVKGGALSINVLILCDDPRWAPQGSRLPPPAKGRHLIVVHAMNLRAYHAPTISLPTPRTFADRFYFKPGDVGRYARSPDPEIHIFPGYGWFNTILHVTKIDDKTRTITVESDSNASEPILTGNRYYVGNVREGLTTPGAWYLDCPRGQLTFWPKTADFRRTGVVAPALDKIFDVRGDPKKNAWVDGLVIKGLQFSDTTYSRDINVSFPADAAIRLSGARGCLIEANRFLDIGGNAVALQDSTTRTAILDNEIGDSDEGGVILDGSIGNQPNGNVISGNWIHDLGLVYKHVAGVFCSTACDTVIAHNLIENVPRYGISLKSYNKDSYSHRDRIEYNVIRRSCLETSDTGAIEMFGGDGLDSGNIVQYNRIEDVIGMTTTRGSAILSPNYAWGVYLDGGESGVRVRGNLVARTPRGGGFIHAGQNDVFENNMFLDGRDSQMLYDSKFGGDAHNVFRHNVVVYHSSGLLFGNIETGTSLGTFWPKGILNSDENLFWHAPGPGFFLRPDLTPLGSLAAWHAAGDDRNSLIADPLFRDTAHGDYRMRPDSPAWKLGFQDLPWSRMGLPGAKRALYLGSRRVSTPSKHLPARRRGNR